jgi:hypothetical protein
VFEVTGAGAVRTRIHAAARRGLTRFVGRNAELEQLGAFRTGRQGPRTDRGGRRRAGVGKSRLVYEFTHSHRLHGWRVLEAASVSTARRRVISVIDLLKSCFKIEDRDDLREIAEGDRQAARPRPLPRADPARDPCPRHTGGRRRVADDGSGAAAAADARRREETALREARGSRCS